jgi:hypothetical protein
MTRWSAVALAGALISFGFIDGPARAVAQISNPVVGGNLAVYFVDGTGPGGGGPAMISLDQAVTQGTVKMYQQPPATSADPVTQRSLYLSGPVAVENLSATQSVFIQLGDLVKGGLQDQVVTRSTILPPRSGLVPIDTLCVDPFRSTARTGDSAEAFSAPGALFPWRLAKLSALAGNTRSSAAQMNVRDVRQQGIWWSIDSLRFKLAQEIGVPLEPADSPSWDDDNLDLRVNVQLSQRNSHWKTSLPLSLENLQLARAEQPYLDALQAEAGSGNSIGAVFVINGQIASADVYRSHELLLQMWPKLLRAYAAEAIAFGGTKPVHLPTLAQLKEFLANAEQAPANDLGAGNVLHESDAAIYAVTSNDEGWVYRSYVAKYPSDRLAPEGMFVDMLDTGKVGGVPIASIDDNQMVALRADGSGLTAAVLADPSNPESTQIAVTLVHTVPVTQAEGSGPTGDWLPDQQTQLIGHATERQNQIGILGEPSPWLVDFALLVLVAFAPFLFRLVRSKGPASAATPKPAVLTEDVRRAAMASLQQRRLGLPRQDGGSTLAAPVALQLAVAKPITESPRRQWRVIAAPAVKSLEPVPTRDPINLPRAA